MEGGGHLCGTASSAAEGVEEPVRRRVLEQICTIWADGLSHRRRR